MEVRINGIILSAISGSFMRWFAEPDEYCISDEICQQIRQCEDSIIDVAVESPGGDIVAAFGIVNALADWCMAHPAGRLEVFVGAQACSAAAAVVAMVPRSRSAVHLHSNSQLMFHSVYTEACGGPDAMRDTAVSLEQLNAQIQGALLSRTTIPPATVAGWFAEGRQGWLTAAQCLEFGLADDILSVDAEPFVFSDKLKTNLDKEPANSMMNLKFLKSLIKNMAKAPSTPKNEEPEEPGKPAVPQEPPAEPEKPEEPADPEEPEEPAEPEEPEEPEEPQDDESEELEKLQEENKSLKARIAELEEELTKAEAAKNQAEAKLARLTGGFRNSAGAARPQNFRTWKEALAAYTKEHPTLDQDDAFVACAKAYPALYKSTISPVKQH